MAKTKKEIIQILATKYNIPLAQVESAVNYQFIFPLAYVAKTMKEGNFESVRLPKFGKFSAKPGRIKYIQEKADGSINNK